MDKQMADMIIAMLSQQSKILDMVMDMINTSYEPPYESDAEVERREAREKRDIESHEAGMAFCETAVKWMENNTPPHAFGSRQKLEELKSGG